jgi:hypothetical protein
VKKPRLLVGVFKSTRFLSKDPFLKLNVCFIPPEDGNEKQEGKSEGPCPVGTGPKFAAYIGGPLINSINLSAKRDGPSYALPGGGLVVDRLSTSIVFSHRLTQTEWDKIYCAHINEITMLE